jgi:hypothetical protein
MVPVDLDWADQAKGQMGGPDRVPDVLLAKIGSIV